MRRLVLAFCLLTPAAPALAQTAAADLRALARAGDVEAVEDAFAEARAGRLVHDELRSMTEALMVFDPEVLAFTEG